MPPSTESAAEARPLEVIRLGRVRYAEAFERMEARRDERLADHAPDTLFLLEHEPVFTLGRRADPTNILAPPEVLEAAGIEVVETGRGGDVTYHGPGQIVGYPVVSLAPERKDVKRYVADLEQVMIDVCSSYGLEAGRSPGQIGCWLNEGQRKIGAIGVRITKWVTSHGFALNVSPRMGHFGLIVPCGIADKPVTSMEVELGRAPPWDEVMDRCEAAFRERFGQRRATLRA
ncbi:MAG: lipoyl(octanoyl) transferase LipB [Myxococcota bacterium]